MMTGLPPYHQCNPGYPQEENVKATFFSIGNLAEVFPDEIRRQYEEGHGIGNHTYTHKFRQIYADPRILWMSSLKPRSI